MTLTEALEQADRLFDSVAAQNLLDAAMMVRDMGGTDAEVAAFMERRRGALARSRAEMHEAINVFYVTGFDSPSVRVN